MKQKSKLISKVALLAVLLSMSVTAVNAESLYPLGASRFSNIADKMAQRRGDTLQVIVAHSRSTTNTLTMSTSKEETIKNKVNQFLFSAAASGFGTHNGELPATDITGENSYDSGGTITSAQTQIDTFSVQVIDVLPNGNLVIQGARRLKSSGQTEFVTMSGIVRFWDITSANTINSNLISDLRIEYISEGPVRNAQKKGWLGKLNEILNPF